MRQRSLLCLQVRQSINTVVVTQRRLATVVVGLACAVVCILSLRNKDLTDTVSIRKLLCDRQSAWWLTLYGSLRAVFSALSGSKIAGITSTAIPDRGVELLRYSQAGIPTVV